MKSIRFYLFTCSKSKYPLKKKKASSIYELNVAQFV